MGSALDSSLEDLIRARKAGGQRGVGRARAGRTGRGAHVDSFFDATGLGPIRRDAFPSSFRSSPYSIAKTDAEGPWKHDLFEAEPSTRSFNGPSTGIEKGTKVLISNLDYGVSDEDIKELFSEVGEFKWSSVRYDRSGRSEGWAEVLYAKRKNAETAVTRYNDVLLDGKPMKVQIKETLMAIPMNPGNGLYAPSLLGGHERRYPGNMFQSFGVRGVNQSGQILGSSEPFKKKEGPDRRAKDELEQKLRSDLDADLERYHAQGKTSS